MGEEESREWEEKNLGGVELETRLRIYSRMRRNDSIGRMTGK